MMRREIKVIHTFVDPETGEESDKPFPSHINRIVAGLKKCQEDEEKERAVKIKAQE